MFYSVCFNYDYNFPKFYRTRNEGASKGKMPCFIHSIGCISDGYEWSLEIYPWKVRQFHCWKLEKAVFWHNGAYFFSNTHKIEGTSII